jgi:chaperonin GroEL (HSP60 family)
MPAKQVLFRSDAREVILRGASALADAVRVTLGPKSKRVLIDKSFGHPLVCNDEVTIAKEMELTNPVENLGAKMIREAAERTSEAGRRRYDQCHPQGVQHCRKINHLLCQRAGKGRRITC